MERSRVSFVSVDEEFATAAEESSAAETIEELAVRVLFSRDLSAKLRPALLVDEPGRGSIPAPPSLPAVPERPEFLRFASSGSARPGLPAEASLVNEENRGVLLHFFANHELLAAELMALALLKFPDAPAAFRKGLAATLKEEQRHTRWYINRMTKCGVSFGEYPVNRFFWDAVSSMESPLDYVSRLSLTFEQANLDYSRHFSRILETAGDSESAAILSRIYHDEISHVGYGLHWFRQWKNPEESDWSALTKQLHFPLSPSRAKGNRAMFNEEGRREAGFDEDYIRQLSFFERSRGRTPNVFYFNPDTENRIGLHPRPYTPSSRVLSVSEDLEILPLFLARRDDVVVMKKPPSEKHREKLKGAGLILPEIELLRGVESGLLKSRKIHQFRPWGIGPDLPERFGFLRENSVCVQPGLHWSEESRELFSKSEQAVVFAEEFGLSLPVPESGDMAAAVESLSQQRCETVLLKRPFSTAGGGMRRLSLEELKTLSLRGLSVAVEREGGILLEPCHDRVFDFSIQYEMGDNEIRKVGMTSQIIAPSGGYRGTISFPRFCAGLDPEIARFLNISALKHYEEDSSFVGKLRNWLVAHGYRGPVGVDAYLHRAEDGSLAHRIACEINTRYTMGRVAHEIRRQVAPECGLRFEIGKASEETFADTAELVNGKIRRGTLYLTEPHPGAHFAAKITVAKRRDDL